MGPPATCHLLRQPPLLGQDMRRAQGAPSFVHPGGRQGQPLPHPLRGRPGPPPPTRSSGARPYLSLQGHGPHGQAAHGLVCDLPPAHREVTEGVWQLLGVVLRRDLHRGGERQEASVPVGAWARGGAGPLLRAPTPAARQPSARCPLFSSPALLTSQGGQHRAEGPSAVSFPPPALGWAAGPKGSQRPPLRCDSIRHGEGADPRTRPWGGGSRDPGRRPAAWLLPPRGQAGWASGPTSWHGPYREVGRVADS